MSIGRRSTVVATTLTEKEDRWAVKRQVGWYRARKWLCLRCGNGWGWKRMVEVSSSLSKAFVFLVLSSDQWRWLLTGNRIYHTIIFIIPSLVTNLAVNFSWSPKGKSNSQEWVELTTCKVELYWMDFQHGSDYAAVQSAIWLCNIWCQCRLPRRGHWK